MRVYFKLSKCKEMKFEKREAVFVQIGAVVVAAGMSSRMGEFKPMLNIGSISIA